MTPYRVPSWPFRKPWPKPRRHHPVRAISLPACLLLTVTTYLLISALFVLHPLTLAMSMGLRMPDGCGCLFQHVPHADLPAR
jgi:hypothetical protein